MMRTSRPLGVPVVWLLIAVSASFLLPAIFPGEAEVWAQGSSVGEKPKYGGTVRLAEREPPNLDPHLSVSFLTQNAASLVYNGLVRLSYNHEQKSPTDLTILPDLAERWEQVDDKTLVFYLRKGVKFHNKPPVNGREVKAQDVKYSMERFAAKSGFRSRIDEVERIEVVDDYNVKIVTKNPYAPLLTHLASPSYHVILPKEAEEQYGDFN
jgi:peptide/nickel transport system substrate-binding protein